METTQHVFVKQEASQRALSYKELDILHALRGFCAFYVVIYHAKFILWSGGQQYMQAHPRSTWNILDYVAFACDMLNGAGYEMVIFFFVLSGFFIRYAQLKKTRGIGNFYVNRVLRIYPPYIFSLLLSVATLFLLTRAVPQIFTLDAGRELNEALVKSWDEQRNLTLWQAIRSLSFMHIKDYYMGANLVYWSLLPEALFYLAVPIVFKQIRLYYIVSVILYAVWMVFGRTEFILNHSNQLMEYVLHYNFYFASGCMLYDVVVQTSLVDWFRRQSKWIFGIITAGLFGVLLVLALLKLKMLSGLVATVLAVLSVILLLAGFVPRQNPFIRVMHKIGLFSFSLYLFHIPLLLLCYAAGYALTGNLFNYGRWYWLAVPLVTVISYGLYWVTERVSVNYFRRV